MKCYVFVIEVTIHGGIEMRILLLLLLLLLLLPVVFSLVSQKSLGTRK